MADIYLYRARLFGRPAVGKSGAVGRPATAETRPATAESYPWQSVEHDLAEARRLITACGYGRRLPELADAEAALAPGGAVLRAAAEHSGAPPRTS